MKAEFFYADNGVVASTDLGWIQSTFDFLTGRLDRVGLRTIVRKTAGVVFQPCRLAGVQSDESYTRSMTGEGGALRSDSKSGYYACSEGRIWLRVH